MCGFCVVGGTWGSIEQLHCLDHDFGLLPEGDASIRELYFYGAAVCRSPIYTMNKFNLSLIGAALALGAGAACADTDTKLNVWNWSDYIASDTVENFKAATGLTDTNYTLFDNNEMVEARLLSGHSGFDAVMMTSYYVPRLAKAGALQKIDKSKIPNWANLDPMRMKMLATIDPDNEYAYPWTEITIGIGYNKKKIEEIFGKDYKVDSWDFLFKKENSDKLKKCGIAVIDSPIEIVSTVMHVLGKDPASEKADDYKDAEKLLTVLASNTAYLHSSRYINDLASGEICAAIGYSGDILQAADRAAANNQGVEVDYVIPKEGSLIWYDCWTVPAGAEHYDNAMQWFNYLQDGKVAASVSNEIRYILPVKDAMANLDDALKANPSVTIGEELMSKMYFVKPTTSKLSKITNRVWNSMKLNSTSVEDGEEGSGWE